MSDEIAGERVFGNVDDALADRIISRSMENSKEPEHAGSYDVGMDRVDKPKRPTSIMKILIPAALVLIALLVYVVNSKSTSIKDKSKYKSKSNYF
jgi:hypothetical protein